MDKADWMTKVDSHAVGLTLEDMMKLRGEITASHASPCKANRCLSPAHYMVPGRGCFCSQHLPPDVIILPFTK